MNDAKLFHLYTSPLNTNTYIVINGDRGFVVDPGGDPEKIRDIFRKERAKLDAVLLTHAHFDHIGGVSQLVKFSCQDQELPSDPKVFLHKADRDKISSYKNMGFAMGVRVEKFLPDILLNGGESLRICGLDVKALHTPGHSKGGACYIVNDRIFVGDTLFFMSYGRYDFYDGSFSELKNSIVNKLFRLKGNYTLLPGHGEPTSLDFERANNPILNDRETPRMAD